MRVVGVSALSHLQSVFSPRHGSVPAVTSRPHALGFFKSPRSNPHQARLPLQSSPLRSVPGLRGCKMQSVVSSPRHTRECAMRICALHAASVEGICYGDGGYEDDAGTMGRKMGGGTMGCGGALPLHRSAVLHDERNVPSRDSTVIFRLI
ncbi:hypothetical protein EX30DRAFT_227825 [Ascodesmis nigricans]|uniref:Uncharacterized protein n=1 Tax=Ascodesmis nigricans TaxID=341454 RepID=A0A4S2MNI5_9PEZI|nr:hypothetical protein EX30DRAFT_227825 [Ascodesmis nigricans]